LASLAPAQRSNARTGIVAGLVALAMLGLGFAAVPLYRIFCQVTGFGGTPMRADAAPGAQAALAPVGVRFDGNVNSALPWAFKPETNKTKVVPGARIVTYYTAKNLTARESTGTASFNVTPAIAGQYFSKLECFCFRQQTLGPGEVRRMPVVFVIDPQVPADVSSITLSYTFFEVAGTRGAGG
jgi:cytochrome c oxidase assembly protein subunit 11